MKTLRAIIAYVLFLALCLYIGSKSIDHVFEQQRLNSLAAQGR